jgi:hypothetical protein
LSFGNASGKPDPVDILRCVGLWCMCHMHVGLWCMCSALYVPRHVWLVHLDLWSLQLA